MEDENCHVARNRVFYSIPDKENNDQQDFNTDSNKESLLKYISSNVLGKDKVFSGPFGLRRVTYLDYIASGRALKFIEDYIQNEVLPDYGNTHTTTSLTSLQTTLYRHEARDIVRNSVHASEHDSVIFCGSGTTAAVHKLIHGLDLKEPPVVFVGPYEHHSSFLPWTEIGAKVIRIREDQSGSVSISDLDQQLQKWKDSGRQLISCFSAASNITGILVNVNQVTICLHRAGALAFWDYATAAPYVKIDMNPVVTSSEDQPYVYKDAIFLSPHKFVGGVQTPGVLIAKKKLFRSTVPDKCGGGSVFYVRREGHRFLQEPELREEGGTPAIVEAIRAGMVFQLKNAVTPEVIMEKERQLLSIAHEAWKDSENIIILGDVTPDRLPIFSFLIYHPHSGRFLHHNFVASLLNDLFGIQARGGCACAGPYAMDLLGLEEHTAKGIEELLAEDDRLDRTHLRRYREYSHREIIRPGFVRINLPYFMERETLDFVIETVKLVASEGWKLLPQYMFNPETGEWRQRNFQVFKDRKWLGHIKYSSGQMEYKVPPFIVKGELPKDYNDCLDKARLLFKQAEKTKYHLPDHSQMFDEKSQLYRWFLLPSEAASCLRGDRMEDYSTKLPFCPPKLRTRLGLPAVSLNKDETESNIIYEGSSTLKSLTLDKDSADRRSENDFQHRVIEGMDQGFRVESNGIVRDSLSSLPQKEVCSVSSSDKQSITSREVATGISNEKTDERQSTVPKQSDRNSCGDICAEHPTSKSIHFENNTCQTKRDSRTCTGTPVSNTNSSVLTSLDTGSTVKNSDSSCVSTQSVKTACSVSISGKKKRESTSNSDVCSTSKQRKTESVSKVDNCCVRKGGQNKPEGSGERTLEAGIPKKLCKWYSPPKTIFAPFLKAVEDYKMIRDGDRILVCLSGGKDSLSLLHTIRQYQFYSKAKGLKFEFGAVTVDPQTPSYDPSPLKQYLASLGVPYFYEAQCIMEQAQSLEECASICSFCSRMKRGRIYACARRNDYNVLALGQHLDDLSESFLMSFFHNGILRTMKAHYDVEEKDLRVIRPLVYVREKDLRTFAEKNKLPVIAENCPACFEAPKERHRTKQLLAAQEILFPQLYNSMMAAMKPIMGINKTGVKVKDILMNGQQGSDKEEDDLDF